MADDRVALRLRGVTKIYSLADSEVIALDTVDFEAQAGQVVVIMGPSGAGKTTFLTIAGTLMKPTSGTIEVAGIETTKLKEKELASIRRENVGFIFQSFNLLESLTALENVRVVAAGGITAPASDTNRARELLNMFGLDHRLHSLPRQLSGGEKQRVAIARSLMNNPEIILADEPTGNLDYKRGQEVMELLLQISVELRKAVVIVSHDHRVREVAHRSLWLQDGSFRDTIVTANDPVCGQLVEVDSASAVTWENKDYYFCAGECRQLFKANQQKYAKRESK
ncbi:MAG: ATP-binding cassette domain-containing protein [Chloroflexi bacterium]|nr:ATP-binding cassette domain-containing protein [Chloroflexota bacterium]